MVGCLTTNTRYRRSTHSLYHEQSRCRKYPSLRCRAQQFQCNHLARIQRLRRQHLLRRSFQPAGHSLSSTCSHRDSSSCIVQNAAVTHRQGNRRNHRCEVALYPYNRSGLCSSHPCNRNCNCTSSRCGLYSGTVGPKEYKPQARKKRILESARNLPPQLWYTFRATHNRYLQSTHQCKHRLQPHIPQ